MSPGRISPGALSPRLALLLAATRVDGAANLDRTRAILRGGIDWVALRRSAEFHGVLPLVFRHLAAGCPDAVPPDAMAMLRRHAQWTAGRNRYLTIELGRILRLAQAEGVRIVPFKGPVLALQAYGDVTLRQFCDLDLLVSPRDVGRARNLLVRLGYAPSIRLQTSQEPAFVRYQGELCFFRTGDNVSVEVQWRIGQRHFAVNLDADRVWARLGWTHMDGVRVPTLVPEDLLPLLCAHGAKHLWSRLLWVSDLARLLQNDVVRNWPGMLTDVGASGWSRMLALGLRLARDLLGASIPMPARGLVESRPVEELARTVWDRFARDDQEESGFRESWRFHLRARERLSDRARYCLRLATTPTIEDWGFLPLPDWLAFLYYVLRPIRLVRKYGVG